MTNFEKIKNMSTKEMSQAIVDMIDCNNHCPMYADCIKLKPHTILCTDQNNVKKWLESEAEKEE